MLKLGEQYRILLRQRGLKSKNPWVAAEINGEQDGKVKAETNAADGLVYAHIHWPEYPGTLVFRFDGPSKQTANGPVVQATLFLWF
jgi:hypothetical protein